MQHKVFNPDGEHVATCKHVEDAAVLVAFYGDGATIRVSKKWGAVPKIVWSEGFEAQPASESYDFVAQIVERNRQFVTLPIEGG